ncbi:hypothetical protein QKV95_gp043 [Poseidoniales virus YSH_150918]|uniref:Uncharacterized protein n=1 Tax=Poseidoniales virus YSH_150918 TaxID=3071324 RepID=A0A976YFB4_9CAUD|nr:hypothetical protein QKV95_gp043 [Yangshan Harbor Poseidoniales virus]UVF62517.1 hypothetical protein [Poseidoniales virus YSH_150918]
MKKKMRISKRSARELLKEANPKRQHAMNVVEKFQICVSRIAEHFAKEIENSMTKPANSGEGCRVQKEHVELIFSDITLRLIGGEEE